ncbi:hypothetical protein Bhyg_11169, partial [Pseudolycoriella hygida]
RAIKILDNDDQDNGASECDEDFDERSDSEEEHISEASVDDDELSFKSDVGRLKHKVQRRPKPKTAVPNTASNFFTSKDGTKWYKLPIQESSKAFSDTSMKWTNMTALRFYESHQDWKLVDNVELQAFLGLLITAGHIKSCNFFFDTVENERFE